MHLKSMHFIGFEINSIWSFHWNSLKQFSTHGRTLSCTWNYLLFSRMLSVVVSLKTSGFKFGISMQTTFKFYKDWVEIVRKCIFENRTNILQFAKHLRTLTIFFFFLWRLFFRAEILRTRRRKTPFDYKFVDFHPVWNEIRSEALTNKLQKIETKDFKTL